MEDPNQLLAKISELTAEAHTLSTHYMKHEKASKKLEEAVGLCEKWATHEPNSAMAFREWGVVLEILAEHYEMYGYIYGKNKKDALALVKKAIEKFENAIKIDPKLGSAYMSLSQLYLKIGENRKAEQCRETGVKLTVKGVRHISFK